MLFGHSLGSAPTVHLASKANIINEQINSKTTPNQSPYSFNFIPKKFKAVVLLSPISSGIKIISPSIDIKDLDSIDVFCNNSKIKNIDCPIFLIHGQKDEVIPFKTIKEMTIEIPELYEWFPKHGNHSNILTRYRSKFFQKMKFFIDYIEYNKKNEIKDIILFEFNGQKEAKINLKENFMFPTSETIKPATFLNDDYLYLKETNYTNGYDNSNGNVRNHHEDAEISFDIESKCHDNNYNNTSFVHNNNNASFSGETIISTLHNKSNEFYDCDSKYKIIQKRGGNLKTSLLDLSLN